MKPRVLIAILASSLLLAGCVGATTTGGTVGGAEDKLLYKAENDYDYIYRGMGVTAALAKIATANTKNSGASKQAIAQINGLTESFSTLYAMAQAKCGAIEGGQVSQLSDCTDGVTRLRFQSTAVDVNAQFIYLASAALKTDELKSLLNNITRRDILGALWDFFSAAADIAVALQDAYAVERMGAQGLAYTMKYQDAQALVRNYQDALKVLADFKRRNPGTADLPPDSYAVPLYAMFQDIRQSCYDIRGTLPLGDP